MSYGDPSTPLGSGVCLYREVVLQDGGTDFSHVLIAQELCSKGILKAFNAVGNDLAEWTHEHVNPLARIRRSRGCNCYVLWVPGGPEVEAALIHDFMD